MPWLSVGVAWSPTCVTSLLLIVAGGVKIARPHAAAGSLRRSSARLMAWPELSLHRATRTVGLVELAAGGAAMFVGGAAAIFVGAFVVMLFSSFVVLTDAARRRGQACGCWGSLSDGPAGRNEVRNRVVFAVLALSAFAVKIVAPSTRRLPVGVALGIGIAGIAVAALLARGSLPLPLKRVANVMTIGVTKHAASAPRIASRRERRDVLARLRDDAGVQRVQALIGAGPRLEWRHARVSSPRDAGTTSGSFLVSVPGDGVNLRVVVNRGRSMMVIGESTEEVVTLSASRLVVAQKAPRPSTAVA